LPHLAWHYYNKFEVPHISFTLLCDIQCVSTRVVMNVQVHVNYKYSDWLRAGWSRDRMLVGARFFAHIQTGPGAHPLYNGYRVFPGGKAARAWCWLPIPSWCQGWERVELYLYTPFRPLVACYSDLYLYIYVNYKCTKLLLPFLNSPVTL
jgi:hypothetical protein